MSKFVGFIVGTALVVAGIATGNPYLIIQGGLMIVSNAVMLLTMPKTPARQASEMSIQLGEQPRVLLVGECFTAGSLVDGANWGGKYGTDWEGLLIRLADHKCHSLTGFYVNDEYVPYTGNGNYPQFDGDHFELYFRSDTSTQPLPDHVLNHFPGWEATDVGESGCDVLVCYKADKPDANKPAWPGGRPRFGFVVKGALCYDPRLDDTVTGGSGAHRFDDPATWEWSENAAICRYKYVRGVYANDDVTDQSKLLIGRGLTAEEAPPENIIAPANLCDEIAGASQPYDTRSPQPPGLGRLWGFTYSPDFTKFVSRDIDGFAVWDVRTRSMLASGVLDKGNQPDSFTGLSNDGTIYVSDLISGTDYAIFAIRDNGYGAATIAFPTAVTQECCQVRADGDGVEHICTIPSSFFDTFYVDGTEFDTDTTGASWKPRCFVTHSSGDIYAIGSSPPTVVDDKIFFWKVVDVSGGGPVFQSVATGDSVNGASVSAVHCEAANQWVIGWNGDTLYSIDDTAYTINDSVAFTLDGYDAPKEFANCPVGSASIYLKTSGLVAEVSLSTLATIRTLDPQDWKVEDASGIIYDPINHALICGPNFATPDVVTWRFLDRHGGYRVAGPIYANQEFIDVEQMFAAATAGNIITHEGSVELEPGQAKSVVATFTDDDLLVGSKAVWNQGFLSQANQEWVNTVVARYVEPDQKWNDHAAPVVRDPLGADIIADKKAREASITLRLVRYQEQALRIAEIARRMGRIWGRASVKLGPRFCELEDGDWIQWQSNRRFGGATKTFRVEAYQIDEKWQIALTLREIYGSIFADDAAFEQDQSRPSVTLLPPPIGSPDSGDWTLTPTTMDSAGASVPALTVTGAVPDDEAAEAVIAEYWLSDGVGDPVADPESVPWTVAGRYPPSTTTIQITGLTGGATYYVAISYVVSGEPGERLVLGPATVTDLDVSGQIDPIVDGAIDALATKQPVRAATTANATLSSAFEAGDTIDGVVLAAGDRILIKDQSTASANGIYVVNASGAPTRATDADSEAELVGAMVRVLAGTANAGTEWECTTPAPITVGTTALTFEATGSASTESIIIACSDETTAITTGTGKTTFRMPYAFTLTAVRASVTTAPTGSTIIIDINEGGASILSTKLSIDASEKTSSTAASAAVISDTALAADAEITVDFDQVGSTIAGAGVKVYLIGHQ